MTERHSKQLGSSGSWRLLLQGDPDLEPPQPRTSWIGRKWKRCADRVSSPFLHAYSTIPACSSPVHTQFHGLKNIQLLTKGEENTCIKTSCNCSHSTSWNRLSHQFFKQHNAVSLCINIIFPIDTWGWYLLIPALRGGLKALKSHSPSSYPALLGWLGTSRCHGSLCQNHAVSVPLLVRTLEEKR